MRPLARITAIAIAAGAIGGCATTSDRPPEARTTCETDTLVVDQEFDGGAFRTCAVEADGTISLHIAPEDTPPINCSPWYAFRVTPRRPMQATIRLSYDACGHRYVPKTSIDGVSWSALDGDAVTIEGTRAQRTATIRLDLDDRPVTVAAQEVLPVRTSIRWIEQIASDGMGSITTLGTSREGRDIKALTFGNETAREEILLLGRQHPPEVSGALALFHFTNLLLSDHELAAELRQRFSITVVPVMNPDGIVAGHWRHNAGGIDLNRDWGPFTQPETQAVDRWLKRLEADPSRRLRLMLDFHSTRRDVFYILPPDLETEPAGFTTSWLDRLQKRMPDYNVRRDANHDDRPVAKAHFHDRFGIPTSTFELGDETDRALVRRLAEQAALAMAETLLDRPPPR